MTNDSITNIISSLNKEHFNHFIQEMWKVDNVKSDTEHLKLYKKGRLGEGVLEQHWIKWDDPNDAKSFQGFNLIVPIEIPVELLLSSEGFKLFLNKESSIVKRYHRIIKKRIDNWYWPQDGEFCRPKLYFVSNLRGIEKGIYFDKILPQLQELLSPYEYFSEVGIGTWDSFLDQAPEKTKIVLKSLFYRYPNQTSFYWQDGKIKVSYDISESYLKSGVLPGTLSACDTVLSFLPEKKIEVFKEFEQILNGRFNEATLEKFLVKYYRQIFGSKYDKIETQLWLRFPELDIDLKERRLDIFLRNAFERDWELIELKAAGKIVSNLNNVPSLSSRITGAISQLKNYERILLQDSVKRQLSQQGIEYYEPQLRLVIGGKPEIPLPQWRRIKKENEHGLKITTCHELLEEMKYRYHDLIGLLKNE